MENIEYYYGTSSEIEINKKLSPTKKKVGKKTIFVTKSLESAIYYANKAVDKFGGSPVVYVVEPVLRDLQQKNRTDFITSSAKVISIKDVNNT